MKKKTLSIIIPTYNMQALLDQCLSSLILETKELREQLDVIIVNDGSTDRSSDIAHKYADEYPEMFSVIDKKNGNYGSCINAALPHIKGKYVRILDADDSYYNENLHEYLRQLELHDVDIVFSNYNTVDEGGNIISSTKMPFRVEEEFIFSDIPSEMYIAMHCVAYRSSIFNEINYHQTEGISYTDMEWIFHPMSKVEKCYYFCKPIYRYLIGRQGQTVDNSVKLKRVGHTLLSLSKQLEIYKSIPSSVMAHSYLENILYKRAKFVYLAHITSGASVDLATLDKRILKLNPSLYKRLSSESVYVNRIKMHLPVIRLWRMPIFRFLLNKYKHSTHY